MGLFPSLFVLPFELAATEAEAAWPRPHLLTCLHIFSAFRLCLSLPCCRCRCLCLLFCLHRCFCTVFSLPLSLSRSLVPTLCFCIQIMVRLACCCCSCFYSCCCFKLLWPAAAAAVAASAAAAASCIPLSLFLLLFYTL